MYQTALSYVFRLSLFAVWIGGSMMVLAAVMVSVDVLARKILGVTLGGSDEISGYLFAVATAFAFPYAVMHRANVRIDVVYMRLPAVVRGALDIFGLALLTGFAGVVTWRALAMVAVTWKNNSHSITPLHTPLILPQGLWVLGWCLFCLTLVFLLGGLVVAWLRGNWAEVQKLGGALSMEEEIEDETKGVLPEKSDPTPDPRPVAEGV
ncbi:TRAP transporter small permease subunit [Primorskyibacter flagellatus]|uniref:TRAP transporter small permease protein n=1 Tax=Primorskyibacter flagellatus TaxID=1387277 RepID=A0A1W2EJ47_9RHOB|nr:TRAP transporter small permease [Primorskyibacter flagellatus]SMD09740.1 Tripartite ATP-independent transporter, DctQ component [Primorskyibacter flagellatus]